MAQAQGADFVILLDVWPAMGLVVDELGLCLPRSKRQRDEIEEFARALAYVAGVSPPPALPALLLPAALVPAAELAHKHKHTNVLEVLGTDYPVPSTGNCRAMGYRRVGEPISVRKFRAAPCATYNIQHTTYNI